MRMNRRNVLAGIGVAVVGGGGALASGAFSQVEAERSVDLDTSDDADAYLGMEAADGADSYVTTSNGTIGISIDNLNEDAMTTINELISFTDNSPADVSIDTVSVEVINDTSGAISIVEETDLDPFADGGTFGVEIDLESNDAADVSNDAAIQITADASTTTA